MVCGSILVMANRFKLQPNVAKKFVKFGFLDEWKSERKLVSSDKNIAPHLKPGLYAEIIEKILAKCDAIQRGDMEADPESEAYTEVVAAKAFETVDGAPVTIDDCLWAFQNMAVKQVDMSTAPSQGAVALRDRAKVDTNIYKWLLEKISPKSFIDEDVKTDTRALDLVDLESQVQDRWGVCKKALGI
jgi:hypothetical protein